MVKNAIVFMLIFLMGFMVGRYDTNAMRTDIDALKRQVEILDEARGLMAANFLKRR